MQVQSACVRIDLKQAFDLFDRNGDGHISAQELGTVMKQLGFSPSDKEIRRMIAEVDKNSMPVLNSAASHTRTCKRSLLCAPMDETLPLPLAVRAANSMVEFEEFVMLMRKHKALVDREADMRQAFRVRVSASCYSSCTSIGVLLLRASVRSRSTRTTTGASRARSCGRRWSGSARSSPKRSSTR